MLALVTCGPSDELISFRYGLLLPELQRVVDEMEPEFSRLSDDFTFLESEVKLAFINLLLQTRMRNLGAKELAGGLGYARLNDIPAADGVKLVGAALMGDKQAIFEFTGKPIR